MDQQWIMWATLNQMYKLLAMKLCLHQYQSFAKIDKFHNDVVQHYPTLLCGLSLDRWVNVASNIEVHLQMHEGCCSRCKHMRLGQHNMHQWQSLQIYHTSNFYRFFNDTCWVAQVSYACSVLSLLCVFFGSIYDGMILIITLSTMTIVQSRTTTT